MRITTIILSYRRAILIAVYTHLLCESFILIDESKQGESELREYAWSLAVE